LATKEEPAAAAVSSPAVTGSRFKLFVTFVEPPGMKRKEKKNTLDKLVAHSAASTEQSVRQVAVTPLYPAEQKKVTCW
jgi:hypothetical protein